jgi:hypothetical protein
MRAEEHEPKYVVELASIVGTNLPQPDYPNETQKSNAIAASTPSSGAPQNDSPPASTVSLATVREQFGASGLAYTEAQVATFVTALQTKGFVVLSGISGTSKSKIATGFVEMLPSSFQTTTIVDEDLITFQVRPYMTKRRQLRLLNKYLDRFPSFSEFKGTNIPVTIGNERGTGNLRFEFFRGNPTISLWMHKKLHGAMERLSVGNTMVFEPTFDDQTQEVTQVHIYPLTGSTSKTKQTPNHLFLSVRPDWRDSTSLLGYYNPLTQTYEWTEFLKFIIQAAENYKGPVADRIAWFVILDEMNLAHVEYYFADLLSVLESGRNNEGWTSQPLRTTYPDMIADDDVPEHEIYLPPNLYIIGTVNMDETTHAFSPKVLDRAFTIELTDVDFSNYPPTAQDPKGAGLGDDQRGALLQEFSRDGRFHRIDKNEIAEVVVRHKEIRTHLQSLNYKLQNDRFHFGYRVFDEIAQYIAVNDETNLMSFPEAFDWAVFMKVLPKFSGSLARLRSPLTSLLAWAINPENPDTDAISALLQTQNAASGLTLNVLIDGATYPIVAKRAHQMLEALYTDGFVSFG